MIYYKRFIGDYMGDTAHLALAEHGAYAVLLDAYYSTEKPLPAQPDALYRICKAMTKEERKAVLSVADQFFPIGHDGLRRNKRADAEIEKRSLKAGVNREIGKLGGRPKKTEWVSETVTETVSESKTETVSETEPNNNPSHSHSHINTTSKALSGKPDVINGTRKEALEILGFLNDKAGRAYRPTDTNLRFIAARLRDGASVVDCKQVIAKKCREWKGSEMEPYLRPATLFNATKFDQYVGELVPVGGPNEQ